MPLGDVPSTYEVEEVIRGLANRMAGGSDRAPFPVELLEVLANEGDLDTVVKFCDIVVAVSRVEGVPQ